MNKKIKRKIMIFGVVLLLFVSTIAFAGTSLEWFETTVGSFHGSGYTGYQTKSISGEDGRLESVTVGGNYKVSVRMQKSDGTAGAYVNDVTTGHSVNLPALDSFLSGDSIRLHIRNNWTTPVNVQVSGYWKSN